MMVDQATKKVIQKYAPVALSVFIVAVVISIVLGIFIVRNNGNTEYKVSGDSMYPTLHSGQVINIDEAEDYEQGQIVVFHHPDTWSSINNSDFIKRIHAVPHDKVTYSNGNFRVNGNLVYQLSKQNAANCKLDDYSHVLEDDELFVLGDNKGNSTDSSVALCEGRANPYLKFDSVVAHGEAHVVNDHS